MQDTKKNCVLHEFEGFNILKYSKTVEYPSHVVEPSLSKDSEGSLFLPTVKKFEKIEEYETVAGVKYYARPYDILSPLVVVLDWLTVRIRDFKMNVDGIVMDGDKAKAASSFLTNFKDNVAVFGVYTLRLRSKGTHNHQNVCDVYYDGEAIGEMCFGCRGKIVKDATYRLKNHVFYDGNCLNWFDTYLKGFVKAVGTEITGISRCDIAVDGVEMDWIQREYNYSHRWEKLGTGHFESYYYDRKKRCHVSFGVGKRGRDKYARYYNKSKEIRDNDNKKQYIHEFHKLNGLDTTKDIKRFELELRSGAFRCLQQSSEKTEGEFEPFDIECLATVGGLVGLLKTHTKNWFEFVPADSTVKTKSHRPRLQLINFENIKQTVFYERIKREVLEKKRTAKIIIKDLLKRAYFANGANCITYLFSAAQYVKTVGLSVWLMEKGKYFLEEFAEIGKAENKKANPIYFHEEMTINKIVGSMMTEKQLNDAYAKHFSISIFKENDHLVKDENTSYVQNF